MEISDALSLINDGVVYRPHWKFSAADHTNRFEGAIKVRVDYRAPQTNRDAARDGYQEKIDTYATFPLLVADCPDPNTLLRRLLDSIIEIDIHEARELLRVPSLDFEAPFHPHRVAGMQAWASTEADALRRLRPDFQFGLA